MTSQLHAFWGTLLVAKYNPGTVPSDIGSDGSRCRRWYHVKVRSPVEGG